MALFGNKKTAQSADNKEEKKDAVKAAAPSMSDLYSAGATTSVKSSKSTAKASKTSKVVVPDVDLLTAAKILLRPVITEKATNLVADNKYVFAVSTSANKISVANAVRVIYGVTPSNVNILNVKGKAVTRGRIKGRRKDWRKAVVTLPKGQSIKIYEGV